MQTWLARDLAVKATRKKIQNEEEAFFFFLDEKRYKLKPDTDQPSCKGERGWHLRQAPS